MADLSSDADYRGQDKRGGICGKGRKCREFSRDRRTCAGTFVRGDLSEKAQQSERGFEILEIMIYYFL